MPETGYRPQHKIKSLRPDRIVLIGDLLNLRTIIAECFGTIAFFRNSGNSEIFMILVDGVVKSKQKDSNSNSSDINGSKNIHTELLEISKRVSRRMGISPLYLMNFDFGSASQQNVNLLRSLLDPIQPNTAIMPLLKCRASDQKMLARSSLIACRSVQNLLMYNPDSSLSFRPQLISDLAPKDCVTKDACLKMVADSDTTRLAPFPIAPSVNSANTPILLERGKGPTPAQEEVESFPRGLPLPTEANAKTVEGFAIHRLVFLS